MEQPNELECTWDLRCLENDDNEGDLIHCLIEKYSPTEDDCSILKLSCSEDTIEQQALLGCEMELEIVIEEHASIILNNDESLIDEELNLL